MEKGQTLISNYFWKKLEESSSFYVHSLRQRDGALKWKLVNLRSYSGFNFSSMSLLSFNSSLWDSSIMFSATDGLADYHSRVVQARQFFTQKNAGWCKTVKQLSRQLKVSPIFGKIIILHCIHVYVLYCCISGADCSHIPTTWVTANEQFQYCTDLERMLMAMPGAGPRFGMPKVPSKLLILDFLK